MHDLIEGWGEGIRARRKDRGLTLKALAIACGVTEATMSRIETGKLAPSDDMKWKIAGVLRVRMDRLWPMPMIVPPEPELEMTP